MWKLPSCAFCENAVFHLGCSWRVQSSLRLYRHDTVVTLLESITSVAGQRHLHALICYQVSGIISYLDWGTFSHRLFLQAPSKQKGKEKSTKQRQRSMLLDLIKPLSHGPLMRITSRLNPDRIWISCIHTDSLIPIKDSSAWSDLTRQWSRRINCLVEWNDSNATARILQEWAYLQKDRRGALKAGNCARMEAMLRQTEGAEKDLQRHTGQAAQGAVQA